MMSTRFFSMAHQPKSKFILVIRDQSGSMHGYKKNLDLACLNLQTKYGSSSAFGLHFIAFADLGNLGDSPRIMDLEHISGSTSIAQAFKRAIEIVGILVSRNSFREIVVVFISDGEDNKKDECELELQQLQGMMPCKSKLFCVGCHGFPTGFVAGTPFKIFGTGNDECEAPVIACPTPDDVPYVFAELEKLIESDEKIQLINFQAIYHASPSELVRAAQCSYNRAVNRSMYFKLDTESRAFFESKRYLASVMSALVAHVKSSKRADSDVVLSRNVSSFSKMNSTELAASVEIVRRLYKQASDCLDMAERGEMISQLDDESKLQISGLAGRLGVLTNVVLKYHTPDAKRIKESLLKFLEEYPVDKSLPPAKFDAEIELDNELTPTLYHVFSDAKSVLPLLARNWSAQDIVERFPFVGYPVECAYISKGAAMNPWLVQVVDFDPSRLIWMQDLKLEFPWNCMLIIPSFNAGSDTSYVKFAASCLLYGGGVFQNEAYWSLLGACVTNLLECNVTYSLEWRGVMSALYAQLRRCFLSVYPWAASNVYFQKLVDPVEFRKCLITECPVDGEEQKLTCPHLTKFVFGVWYKLADADASRPFLVTGERLRGMYLAFLVEFFYRAGQRFVWTSVGCKVPMEQLLDPLVYRRVANLSSQAPTLSKVTEMYWPCVKEYVEILRKSPELIVDMPSLDEEKLGQTKHYQFNLDSIKGIFAGFFYCARGEFTGDFTTALTQRDLARLLLVAQKHNNVERNTDPDYDKPLPEVWFLYFFYYFICAWCNNWNDGRNDSSTWPTAAPWPR